MAICLGYELFRLCMDVKFMSRLYVMRFRIPDLIDNVKSKVMKLMDEKI